MTEENEPAQNRSIKIDKGATGNVFITGDGNYVAFDGDSAKPAQSEAPKVFVSSTLDDLKQHRAAARNAAMAARLLPIQMEYVDSNGERVPLETCLHKVDEADVVVLIIAHRYGWVPSDQDGAGDKCITWLECERAHADGKEVLAFVVDPEHEWDDRLTEEYQITAAMREGKATAELFADVQRNVARLKEFKSWTDGIASGATFTTVNDLDWKISQALHEWKQRHVRTDGPGITPLGCQTRPADAPDFPPQYRDGLLRQCTDIDLVGIRLKETRNVKLNHVYVPATTPPARDEEATDAAVMRKSGQEPKLELLLDRLNNDSLYVSGAPGSGKSTFCRWVTWLTCTGAMPELEHGESGEFAETYPESLRDKLPVLIRLRDFWNFLPADAGEELSLSQLEQALGRWLTEKKPGDLAWATVAAHIKQGTALVMFDGVDEVPISQGDGAATSYPRAALLAGLGEAVQSWAAKGNRLLVTSRPYGLSEAERQQLGLPTATIEDLPESLQRLLSVRWFRILSEDAAAGDQLAGEMLRDIAQRQGIDELSRSPMLLTAMCVIYREGKRLPEDKCDLYDRIVDNVLYNRVRDPSKIEIVRNELRVVAHSMHTGDATGRVRTSPEAEVDCQEIDRALEAYRPRVDNAEETESATAQRLRRRTHITNRLRACVKDRTITVGLRTAQHFTQLLGNCESDEEMMHWHQTQGLLRQPGVGFLLAATGRVALVDKRNDFAGLHRVCNDRQVSLIWPDKHRGRVQVKNLQQPGGRNIPCRWREPPDFECITF
jgi:hypothetical protein